MFDPQIYISKVLASELVGFGHTLITITDRALDTFKDKDYQVQ